MAVIDPTHSPAWAASLAATQVKFGHDLDAAGFTNDKPGVWQGELEVASLAGATAITELEIEIPDGFPFEPPKVTDIGMESTRTWHHNLDWSLCLYTRRGVFDRPWQTVEGLLDRIQDWFGNAAAGWPDDPPDLDLERYFARVADFVTHDNIDALMGRPVSAHRLPHRWHIDRVGAMPTKKRRRKNRRWGWAGDLGDLEHPVFDWPTVHARLGDAAPSIETRIRDGRYQFLLLQYQRHSHSGVIVLFTTTDSGNIKLRAGQAANDSAATRRLRAGPPDDVSVLAKRSVAIVGMGAVGSFIADHLVRSGIKALHLVDFDILRPGNCVRHFAGVEYAGEYKTKAVAELLAATGRISRSAISTTEEALTPNLAADLLAEHDLVLDATADDGTRGLLAHLARSAIDHDLPVALVSAATYRMGGLIRSDRWPRSSESPDPIPAHPDGELELREGGCGDPVSPTPAHAVVAAAALASRHAIDELTGHRALPDSIIEVLAPQPDEPYNVLGTLK